MRLRPSVRPIATLALVAACVTAGAPGSSPEVAPVAPVAPVAERAPDASSRPVLVVPDLPVLRRVDGVLASERTPVPREVGVPRVPPVAEARPATSPDAGGRGRPGRATPAPARSARPVQTPAPVPVPRPTPAPAPTEEAPAEEVPSEDVAGAETQPGDDSAGEDAAGGPCGPSHDAVDFPGIDTDLTETCAGFCSTQD